MKQKEAVYRRSIITYVPSSLLKINLLKMFFLVIFASLFLFQAAVCEEDETEFALVSRHLLTSGCSLIC